MVNATNSTGTTQVGQQLSNFWGNLTSAGYSGQDGPGNIGADAYGGVTGALFQAIAVGAESTRAIPVIGTVVGATLDIGKGCCGLICPDTSIGGKSTKRGALHGKTA